MYSYQRYLTRLCCNPIRLTLLVSVLLTSYVLVRFKLIHICVALCKFIALVLEVLYTIKAFVAM